tara:strand:+ start:118 stop:399 length:282 start_codon:yes stop_codon:yes gene_type:complete
VSDKDFNNIMDDMRKEIEAYKKFEKEIKHKVEDLKNVLNRCTEEKHNFELLCNSFKERNNQLTKELEEVKLDNIKLAKQVEDSLKQFRNKGEL